MADGLKIERVRFDNQMQINSDMVQSITLRAKKCTAELTAVGVQFFFPGTGGSCLIPYSRIMEVEFEKMSVEPKTK